MLAGCMTSSTFNLQVPSTHDLGLVNCTMETYKREIQTVFTRNIRHPYQNDYILISPGLKNKLRKCYIPKRTEVENLSDHSPVIVELNI
jgi:exonuclease III